MSASTNWEDVYRTQTARIAELERENAELRDAHKKQVAFLMAEIAALRETLSELAEAVMARGLQGEEPTAPAVLRVFKAYGRASELLRKEAQP